MKPQQRLLSLLLALALVWGCIPGQGAAAVQSGTALVCTQAEGGPVELALAPVSTDKTVYGVQLELTLPGGSLDPGKVLLTPADPGAFSPAFATLAGRTDSATTVTLYLVSDYALNPQSSLSLGALTYQGEGIMPQKARAGLVDQDILLNGGAVEMKEVPVNTGGSQTPELPYTDVEKGSWYYDAVVYVHQRKLMSGVGNNRFNPGGSTSRGMIVTILYQLEGRPAVSGDLHFSDVPGDKWYSRAVSWASQNGIVAGYDDGTFRPDKSITRQELALILYRYAGFKGYDRSAVGDLERFPDRGSLAKYAEKSMIWAVGEKLIGGADGKLVPTKGATRAQLATILRAFLRNR